VNSPRPDYSPLRRGLLAGLALCLLLFFYNLLRYPEIGGSLPGRIAFALLGVAIVGLYGWAVVRLTRLGGGWFNLALQWGTLFGAATAILWLAEEISLVVNPFNQAGVASYAYFITLVGQAAVGAVCGWQTRRLRAGALAGLWSGMLTALGMGLAFMLAADLFGVSVWVYDAACTGAANLAACQIGILLGGSANTLLIMPLVSAVLGGVGGLAGSELGRLMRRNKLEEEIPLSASEPDGSLRYLWIFVGILTVTFIIGVTGSLW
jgi:hypothetical protein